MPEVPEAGGASRHPLAGERSKSRLNTHQDENESWKNGPSVRLLQQAVPGSVDPQPRDRSTEFVQVVKSRSAHPTPPTPKVRALAPGVERHGH
ncbi:hypothetical protein ANTRET_LOCUS2438 [Anthophora retusa]